MMLGAFFVGLHMALTHGVTLGMMGSYIPNVQVPGIGRVNGTCWSFTDFIFGAALDPCSTTELSLIALKKSAQVTAADSAV